MTWTPDALRAFEQDIADTYTRGEIRAPIHLAGGNEDELIRIFEDVRPLDWVCGAWRMHYHCLLKGVPPETLKADIVAGRSISLCYPERRIITSAIVGGIIPIALGIAWGIKRRKENARVWVFVGDMTSRAGIFLECLFYANAHGLPLTLVVEDNGKSVCTDTAEAWGEACSIAEQLSFEGWPQKELRFYSYVLPWPHSGVGKRIDF